VTALLARRLLPRATSSSAKVAPVDVGAPELVAGD